MMEETPNDSDDSPLFCDRCLKSLHTGRGEFFEVKIEAVADPSPPDFGSDLNVRHLSIDETYDEVVSQLNEISEQEAMDQVIRRVRLTVCCSCFNQWIEDPAGK